jgi:CRISPR-associated protein Csh2
MAKTREFVLFSDCTMANPNGDMINENRPRQDERTGRLEMSDVRIKRYIRDEMLNRDMKVYVKPVRNDKGKFINAAGVAARIVKEENIKDTELEKKLREEYLDVKLFGAVVTKPKFNITGPLQVMWSRSMHEAEVKFAQGTSVFTSKAEADQGTIWSKYYTPYALFKTYMVFNDNTATVQKIKVSEEEIEIFKELLLNGIKNYRSTSKNQMPRLLVEVIYKNNYMDGELDYIDVKGNVSDLEIRDIKDFTFDLTPLENFYKLKSSIISEIKIYKHPKVNLIGSHESFTQYEI